LNNLSHPRYKAVLFDIDDTLLTTREPKWRQHKWVAKHYYGIALTDAMLLQNWGKPFDELAAILYQGRGTTQERRANFTRHELEFPKQYEPHALQTIQALHDAGLTLGLMTAMFMEGARIDLQNLQMPLDYFAIQQGSEATPYHKPDGRVFEPALATLAAAGITDDIVYVGEALSDYQSATNAGLDFIAITQGLVDRKGFLDAGATQVFNNLLQIQDFILNTQK
jgi:phosphoglycolate phosphatase-like HAD superfamily hydrolase